MPRKPHNGIAPMTSTERSKAARDRMHAEMERLRAENAALARCRAAFLATIQAANGCSSARREQCREGPLCGCALEMELEADIADIRSTP